MILLDTDHVTVLRMPRSARRDVLVARLAGAVDEEIGVAVITVEEQMRGWLAAIAKETPTPTNWSVSRTGRVVRVLRRVYDSAQWTRKSPPSRLRTMLFC